MATFAEYPTDPMASSNNADFTLYPYQEWSEESSFLPSSTYEDQSYLCATTYDSHSGIPGLAPLPEYTHVGYQTVTDAKNQFATASPEYSPAQSASHSIELNNRSVLSDSGASIPSTISSAMGSPSAQPQSLNWQPNQLYPGIVQQPDGAFSSADFNFESFPVLDKICVDPALIQPLSPSQAQYPDVRYAFSPSAQASYTHMPSPTPSHHSIPSPDASKHHAPVYASPHMQPQSWQPYPQNCNNSRRPSISSVHSRQSSHSLSSDDSNKGRCPIATCRRHVKDLKAHMLTHQNERPEKCPIPNCEYHIKGFARKYDKNRHTLTHYKGTMVCGFCPGSGSAAEKSFNRADVFKRHLTTVHGVEQTAPNSRRRSPPVGNKQVLGNNRDTSGMCSTCSITFANAQDFYEHLDDCVLRVVQQADPSEAINEQILSSMVEDDQVQKTMEKHMLPTGLDYSAPTSFHDDEEADDDDEVEDEDLDSSSGSRASKPTRLTKARVSSSGAICKTTSLRKGLTCSKGGVPLAGPLAGKGGKRKKNYPLSWGATPDKMKMKKRVMCVYEGQRRLWKDDMMLHADHEVRIPLPGIGDGRAWVTDLDQHTLARAEAVLNATDEEKGPWIEDGDELERLML